MSAKSTSNVITFDNLVRATDIVGQLEPVKAIEPSDVFVHKNATGVMRQHKSREEIRECAAKSGERLLSLLKA